jgi:cupin 2 domain-containing protein
MNPPSNLFADIPAHLPAELVETLLASRHFKIERIVSQGHASPEGFWYDQNQDEWVLLLQGSARLRFEDSAIDLKPGDWINIAAHRRHRVETTDAKQMTIWLAIHYWNAP